MKSTKFSDQVLVEQSCGILQQLNGEKFISELTCHKDGARGRNLFRRKLFFSSCILDRSYTTTIHGTKVHPNGCSSNVILLIVIHSNSSNGSSSQRLHRILFHQKEGSSNGPFIELPNRLILRCFTLSIKLIVHDKQ